MSLDFIVSLTNYSPYQSIRSSVLKSKCGTFTVCLHQYLKITMTQPIRHSTLYVQVLRFLQGIGRDGAGRTLEQILSNDDTWFENQHDFVQWLFPSTRASDYNSHAPVLTIAELGQLGADEQARKGLSNAYARMLRFLGLQVSGVEITEAPNPSPWVLGPAWMRRRDHNDLRITRMLECLHHAGLAAEAMALLAFLERRFSTAAFKAESLSYWQAAVRQ